jgi:hypothetical protein
LPAAAASPGPAAEPLAIEDYGLIGDCRSAGVKPSSLLVGIVTQRRSDLAKIES